MSETSSRVDDNCRCDYSYLRAKNKIKFQAQTTNKTHFKAFPVEQKPTYEVPKVKQNPYDSSLLKTSYKDQFQKPPAPDTSANINQSASLVESYYKSKKANTPFYAQTQYKKSFESKPVKIEKQPPYEYKPNKTKFQGQSAYKQQFVAKKNSDLLSAGTQMAKYMQNYHKNKPKFEGESSYKQTFQHHAVKPEKQPEYKYQPKNVKFEGQTSYKTTFTPLPSDVYKNDLEYCPIHPERVAIKK